MQGNKTNFFIIGTPKGGTTSLFHYLEQHPDIFVPTVKEPHFFSCPEVKDTYYKATFIDTPKAYQDLYVNAKTPIVADFSSSYLHHNQSAARIFNYNQEAKLLAVLRNPISRALSHYLMDVTQGYVEVPLMEILENPEKHGQFFKQYVEVGKYDEQLVNYLTVFPREQLKIVLSERFFDATEEVLKELFDFLKIDTHFSPIITSKFNQYKTPRFGWIGKLKQGKLVQKVLQHIPNSLKRPLSKVFFDEHKEKPTFENEQVWLQEYYQESIVNTEKLIGISLDHWKK